MISCWGSINFRHFQWLYRSPLARGFRVPDCAAIVYRPQGLYIWKVKQLLLTVADNNMERVFVQGAMMSPCETIAILNPTESYPELLRNLAFADGDQVLESCDVEAIVQKVPAEKRNEIWAALKLPEPISLQAFAKQFQTVAQRYASVHTHLKELERKRVETDVQVIVRDRLKTFYWNGSKYVINVCDVNRMLNDALRTAGSPLRVFLDKDIWLFAKPLSETKQTIKDTAVWCYVFDRDLPSLGEGDMVLAYNDLRSTIAISKSRIRDVITDRSTWTLDNDALYFTPMKQVQDSQTHLKAIQEVLRKYEVKGQTIPEPMMRDAIALVTQHEIGHFHLRDEYAYHLGIQTTVPDGMIFHVSTEILADTYVLEEIAKEYAKNPTRAERLHLLWITLRRGASPFPDRRYSDFKAMPGHIILGHLLRVYHQPTTRREMLEESVVTLRKNHSLVLERGNFWAMKWMLWVTRLWDAKYEQSTAKQLEPYFLAQLESTATAMLQNNGACVQSAPAKADWVIASQMIMELALARNRTARETLQKDVTALKVAVVLPAIDNPLR